MGIYPDRADVSVSRGGDILVFFRRNFVITKTESRDYLPIRIYGGYTEFFASRSSSPEALDLLSRGPRLVRVTLHRASTPRACREALARASFRSPDSCGTSPTFVFRERASRERRARRAARFPSGVTRRHLAERTPKATTRETSPRRARAGVARERPEPPRFPGWARRVCFLAICRSRPGGS